ncbi:MAG: hypothetical protein GXO92_01525 [FCB group bacterium]|nr:hypothetical protein [FCB group bacterium]
MILTALLSLISIYPWNAGVTLFGTTGQYSTGEDYLSKAVYFAMDRRLKDGFTVGYEDISIRNDSTTYRQYNTLARDIFWIKPQLRFGGIVGHIATNVTDDGWLWGTQIEGDLPWFGYALGYTHSDYQNWQPLFNNFQNTTEILIEQWDFSLSRRVRKSVFRVGLTQQSLDSDRYQTISGAWLFQPYRSTLISLNYAFGESRYAVDPYALLLDNNPDILNRVVNFRVGYRITPNWSVSAVYSDHLYTGATNKAYRVRYFAAGIQVRY